MDIPSGKSLRKKLGELLVEAGIVKPEQMPKGLEFAQKVTDADIIAVRDAKQLIADKGLDVSTAIKAISLSKQKHSTVDQSLQELGWAPKASGGPEHVAASASAAVAARSQFDRSQLDAIGRKSTGEVAGLTARFGQPVTSISTSETAKPNFDARELDAIKPEEDLSRKSLTGLKAIAAAQTARVNPIAALGSTQPVSAAAPAGKRDHTELLSEADHAFSKHNYELAESLYEQALNALECKPDSTLTEVSEVLFKTGKACVQIREFGRAEQYFSRALKIRELHCGPSPAVAECMDQMAEMYELQNHLEQAVQYYFSALTVKERVLAGGSPEVAVALKKLVAVIKRKGLHPEEKLSGELFTESGMANSAKLSEGLSFAQKNGMPIGRALIALNCIDEADLETVLQAQLLLRQGLVPTFMVIRALRTCHQSKTSLTEALTQLGLNPAEILTPEIEQLQGALHQLIAGEKEHGTDSPHAASLCLRLGDLYIETSQHKNAESLYLRAARILERNAAANRGDVVSALTKLGRLHYNMRQFAEADAILTRLIQLFKQPEDRNDMSYATAAESLGAVKYIMGNYDQSATLYQSAIECKEQSRGAQYAGLIPTLQGRANCHFAQGEFAQAERLYRRAVEIVETTYGPQSEYTAGLTSALGDVLLAQNQFAQAQSEYMHCLDAIGNAEEPDLEMFCTTLQKMAHCCAQQNDLQRADAYYRHFFKTRQTMGTERHSDLVEALERHAAVLEQLGQRDEASLARQRAQTAKQRA